MAPIFDGKGEPVVLGAKIGHGGEGAVYNVQGRSDSVAKIYFNPTSSEHATKLSALVEMAQPNLLRLAALPTGTLRGPAGTTVGFLMPKFTGQSPVFKLYGPKPRLQEFPKADWRFLIHAAANAARAFTTIHSAGLVIGDVNHGNLVVGQDATVRLIDCDSFQVTRGGRIWFCEVGVGTHQPPEMQSVVSYAGVTRTANHDNFGLAIIIFQLLCIARHPFAGRYLGPGEQPSIEEAIASSRYAYSRDQKRTLMAPPPGCLPIDALTRELQDLFEAAFAPSAARGGRPTGDQWVGALQELASSVRECPRNQAHRYLSRLPSCPWCEIETASGALLFPVVFVAQPGGMVALWQEVTGVGEPPPLPPLQDPHDMRAAPSEDALATAQRGQRLKVAAYGAIATALIAVIAFAPPAMCGLFVLIVGVLSLVILKTPGTTGASPEHDRLSDVRREWEVLRAAWHAPAFEPVFADIRRGLDTLKAEYDGLPTQRAKRLQQLSEQIRQKQMEEHLDRFSIASAKISRIGPAKVAMLASHGIDTAGDIVEARVLRVPGFGPATVGKLLAWRHSHERTFRFDPSRGVSSSDIAIVERDIAMLRAKLEHEVATGLHRLKKIPESANARRQALKGRAAELLPKYAQALADASVVPKGKIAHERLLALAAVTLALVLFTQEAGQAPRQVPQTSVPAYVQPPARPLPTPLPQIEAARVLPPTLRQPSASPETVDAPAIQEATRTPVQSAPNETIQTQTAHTHTAAPVAEAEGDRMVTRQSANVRSAPVGTASVLRIAPQGTVLRVHGRSAGWVQVGDETPWGWIYSSLLDAAP